MTATTTHATAEHFKTWAARARTMTQDELEFARDDARKAAEAMKGWNPTREGYYADEAHTYTDELMARRKAA